MAPSKSAMVSKKKKMSRKDEGPTRGLSLLKRDAVTMTSLGRQKSKRKVKKKVLFNKKGVPYGKVVCIMQLCIGKQARRKVPITCETWKDVDPLYKALIWKRVQKKFLVGPENKEWVMKSANDKWREFKSRLTSKYIIPYLNDPEMRKYPPEDYPFIPLEDWTTFVASRISPEFLADREKQQEKRKKHKHPHSISCGGYGNLEHKLGEELGVEEGDLPRGSLQGHPRRDENGNYKDDTKEVGENIDRYQERIDKGDMEVKGTVDALILALQTKENRGRVRGIGGHVTPTAHFQHTRKTNGVNEAAIRVIVQKIFEEEKDKIIEEARGSIIEEARASIMAEITSKLPGFVFSNTPNTPKSGVGSCFKIVGESSNHDTEQVVKGDGIGCPCSEHPNLDVVQHVEENVKSKSAKVNLEKGGVIEKNVEDKSAMPNENNQLELKVQNEGIIKDNTVIPLPKKKSFGFEKQCKLAIGSVDRVVAYGTYMDCDDNSQLLHGTLLGEPNMCVSIDRANHLCEKEKVPFPVPGKIETVKEDMGSWVAWPKDLIIRSVFVKEATIMDTAEKKRKRKKPYGQLVEAGKKEKPEGHAMDPDFVFKLDLVPSKLPAAVKNVCKWADEKFRDKESISFDIEPEVFGFRRKTYIIPGDVQRLAGMNELSGNCIAIYERYLYDRLIAYKMVDMVAFFDPARIGGKGCGTKTDKVKHMSDRFLTAKTGQIFLLPYNPSNKDHWMLAAVDPDQNIVYFMDPLRKSLPVCDFKNIVDDAIVMFNDERQQRRRQGVLWTPLKGIPEQPDDKQCGFFVMRFMRDIIESKDMTQFLKMWEKPAENFYSASDIDVVRTEWAKFVLKMYS